MNNIDKIKSDDVYKQIMADTHGGIMYSHGKVYAGNHLIKLWNETTASNRESAGGIVRGAIEHLKEVRDNEHEQILN